MAETERRRRALRMGWRFAALLSAAGVLTAIVSCGGGSNGSNASTVASTRVATPTITTAAALNGAEVVTITDSAAGATIYYTLDSSTPTTNSPQYTAPFLVASNITLTAIAAVPGGTPSQVSSQTLAPNIAPGTLVWDYEFSSDYIPGSPTITAANGAQYWEPNTNVWTPDSGPPGTFGSGELETYCAWGSSAPNCDSSNPNYYVGADGNLHIRVDSVEDPSTCLSATSSTCVYTSGRIKTQGEAGGVGFSLAYGRIEASIELPTTEAQGYGQGLWPAFWMLGNDYEKTVGWPACGEIDIMENYGYLPSTITGSIHGTGFTGSLITNPYSLLLNQPFTGFHTFGILWSPAEVQFYVDSPTNVYAAETPANLPQGVGACWAFDNGPFFFLLNVAVGPNGLPPVGLLNGDGSPNNSTVFPSELLVKYVRVYTASFPLSNPVPAITSVSPFLMAAGSPPYTLTINGTGFLSSSTVTFNGSARPTLIICGSALTISLTSEDLATAGTYPVVVTNPAPGGGASNAVNFTVFSPSSNNPVPAISSLSPPSLAAGSAPQTLTINGTGFIPSSTVTLNGIAHAADVLSATLLTISLTSADLATAGTYPVVVTNPTPGGGSSAAAGFSVTNVLATGEWAWIGGSSTIGSSCTPSGGQCGHAGVYGTLGTPAAGNIPGSRDGASSWTDSSGNLWLFGGEGFEANGHFGDLNDLWEFNPSTSEWAWMGGSSTVPCNGYGCGLAGVYGTLGTPAAGNLPGGRLNASSWTDSSGNLWLFGGTGLDANGGNSGLNDLWEFSPSAKEWTWMGGSSTVSCGGCGQAGVYGTLGTPAASNIPGGREWATSWTDHTGHFWLFGGWGYDANDTFGLLNDLWEFNPSTKEWAWMGGSSTVPSYNTGNSGVYGTLGTPAAGNIPGGRLDASSWTDSSGHLWLFAGVGYDADSANGYLNDLWEFNPSTNQWAWMGGSNTVGHAGVYGTLGTPASGNIPGGRSYAVNWTDASGNFWLLGGAGNGIFNDLWEFNPSTNEWVWMGGSSTNSQPGVYGALGIPAAGNTPGARWFADGWTDSNGHFWLFGGLGYDANGSYNDLNDLWRYQP